MALLNLRKKKVESDEPVKTKKLAVVSGEKKLVPLSNISGRVAASQVIIRPRVTEKAGVISAKEGREVMVFEVSERATKKTVAEAIIGLYKVIPEKVALLKIPRKSSFVKNRLSKGKIGHKAYVYLKKGDKVETI